MAIDDGRYRVRCADCGDVYAESGDGITWGAGAAEPPRETATHKHRPGIIEIPADAAAIVADLLNR